jgi:phosphatidylglycerophosphatase C
VTVPPVTPAPSVVAAFDFDGTLTRGGSVWPFLVAVGGRRRVVAAAVLLSGRLALAAAFGGRFADDAKEALFRRTLGGLGAGELAGPAAVFGRSHYSRHARADVRARLEWHRAEGHRIVIVSASLDCYLAPVAEDLGVGLVATRLAVGPDGRLTGSYDGGNCRGPEKLARVRRWMAETAADTTGPGAITDVLWAYGNSEGDRQLLKAADIGVDVGRLGRFGSLRAFPRLSDIPDAGDTLTSSAGAGGRSRAGRPGRRRRRR